jgi:hypothetical protein
MKRNLGMMLVLVLVLMVAVAPAYSAQATQVWSCEEEDEATEADLRAAAAEWLKAAKTMKGGENMEVSLFFPVAVDKTGEIDFLFVVSAPSFAEWGLFWDGYDGSPASKVDQGSNSKAICPDSALWETVEIK